MSYDPGCHDLARHFLGDLASEKLVAELAQSIQTQIEDWLEYEAKERAENLQPRPLS